jgi:hypothetical protein
MKDIERNKRYIFIILVLFIFAIITFGMNHEMATGIYDSEREVYYPVYGLPQSMEYDNVPDGTYITGTMEKK